MTLREAIRRFVHAVSAVRRHDEFPPLGQDLGLPTGVLLVQPAAGQLVYRVLGRSEPRDWDFYSDRDKERARAPRQDFVDYVGLSVFGSQAAALDNCLRFPKLVAAVHLSPGNGFSIARTFADIDEHYSVWGEPEALLENVTGDVLRVDAPVLD